MIPNRLRLGFYAPGNGTGGPWRYVHSVLAGLDPGEFDVTVFCDLPGGYDPRPCVKVVRLGGPVGVPGGVPGGAPGIDPPSPAPPRRPPARRITPKAVRLMAGFCRDVRRLAGLIRPHALDLFHTQNTGCEESPVAAKLAGVPRVLGTFHVDSTYDLHRERSDPGHRSLEMVSNRSLDAAIAVSHATKRDWLRRTHIPAGRVVTVHNGIDPDKFHRRQGREAARLALGLPTDGPIVGGLGRLDEAKGFTYLLKAACSLRQDFPTLTVAIAGTGPLREQLERQAQELGLEGTVRFLGFQSDVQTVLDALDVFAMPSRCETLGYALLEAMATGLPAVGAAVGGIPEVIVPGVTGFVVPPRDSASLADALRTLLLDGDLRGWMGTAGRERVVRYFHERDMVRRTVQLYRKLLHARSKVAAGGGR